MSSATEDAGQIRSIILEMFSLVGEGDFKPENAHDLEDDDLELYRESHVQFTIN